VTEPRGASPDSTRSRSTGMAAPHDDRTSRLDPAARSDHGLAGLGAVHHDEGQNATQPEAEDDQGRLAKPQRSAEPGSRNGRRGVPAVHRGPVEV
jgi:hypothetical protein